MKTRTNRIFAADFETTVYDGQKNTEVWSAACVELGTEDVLVLHSIGEMMDYFKSLNTNVLAYFHNLKFDGSFWLDYLLRNGYQQSVRKRNGIIEWKADKNMESGEFKYSISAKGQWYSIVIRNKGKYIEFRDSLKLLPFSLASIGESFKTKHKKLEMEYKGYRFAGCEITPEEMNYIKNDVLVLKEALEIMYSEGHNKLTIGACCLSEYKNICKTSTRNIGDYDEMFVDLRSVPLSTDVFKYENAEKYIRKSYRGGWCYVVRGKESQLKENGCTSDVNSLYPSMMHSDSGNRYPIGYPSFWFGNYIPEQAKADNKYYFVRIKTRFYLKPGKLPFIQVKNSPLYDGTENLETSDIMVNNQYKSHYSDNAGIVRDTRVELTLTMTDYQLFMEHYDVKDFEILDGCWFWAEIGIFDEYIDYYAQIKKTSKGAQRTLAKLFLNNLYGKMATSDDSSFKIASLNEYGDVRFETVLENNKKPVYIPIGSAITSYARNFTIRAAQANYYGADKPGFIYADTDSIHCDLPPEGLKGITMHPYEFCCWKLESEWDRAIFVRQKTYIEHVICEDGEPCEPWHDVKCAGLPSKCKNLLVRSFEADAIPEDYTAREQDFLFDQDGERIVRTYQDFAPGLVIPGKLLPKRIKGGILLTDTTFEMRE